ncbi:diguanylate cyclase (GGDEF) domain-containing protein [Formivibrio citricus]|uniref:diguanylate cyclase n=1 Tax=Formivibrio citricus TaxID=83765 RepID=A0A1I4V221_9NEIS|nr:diguanylate cyclase [Formivibrio citricus]SFM95153.1 diguanylate cyclase (GGDEF) domain-containing protein [Formivibrio citricus]
MDTGSQRQTILIVDDEPANIRILVELLKDSYDLRTATNGEKAIAIASSDDQPDLILLDIMMPGINGYETCRRLKADERTSHIPVFFITSRNNEQDELEGLRIGAVDYITKPFSPAIIRARVRTHAKLARFQGILEQQSYTDGLTGCANRRRLEEYLATAWVSACREGASLACIMIDLDHFKAFNDFYGHLAGDDCLRQVAHALQGQMQRKTDIVARYGGEEFCCLLPGTDLEGASLMAHKLHEAVLALQIPHEESSAGLIVSISLGVAARQAQTGIEPDSLVKAADMALYAAKTSGRNRICLDETGLQS